MKLHYRHLSSSSRRVRITARRHGIKLEEVAVAPRDPSNRAELVKLDPNPDGTAAVLQLGTQLSGQPIPEGRQPRSEA